MTTELDKVWLITGIGGQDGSICADILLSMGYKNIHGIIRRSAVFNTQNIDHIFDKLSLHYGDVTDSMAIHTLIKNVQPDYICNFAAMSHVAVSEELQRYTLEVNTIGVLNILQSVRSLNLLDCKVYQASTSEEYGNESDGPLTLLDEDSLKNPVSIYGISKLASEHICNMYRDAYGMFVVSSTLFNHEGERRGKTFLTRKVSCYVANYDKRSKSISPLQLGNLYSKRDWGYARDYVGAIIMMLKASTPDNYVIATGETHSVKEFCELAFNEIGVNVEWEGDGLNEKGIDSDTKRVVIEVSEKYYRPIDIQCLIGDSSKARKKLNWVPKTSFKELVKLMVDNEIKQKSCTLYK